MDFGYNNGGGSDVDNQNNNGGGSANDQQKTDLSGQGQQFDANGNPITDLNNQNNNGNNGGGNNNNNHDNDNNNNGDDNNNNGGKGNNDNKIELNAGEVIEIGDDKYTVAENGDLLDKDGKVFKEAKDVEEWLKENDATDAKDTDDLSIDAIREAVGVDVTDESGKPVEFTNDAKGIKSYIDSVIALKSNDIAQGAVNKVFTDTPLLKQFLDYVTVNGSPKGFGDIPDRSGIQLDKDNPSQKIIKSFAPLKDYELSKFVSQESKDLNLVSTTYIILILTLMPLLRNLIELHQSMKILLDI